MKGIDEGTLSGRKFSAAGRAALVPLFVLIVISPLARAQTYTENTLYGFTGGTDGAVPYAGLIRDAAGNLYGTTFEGGDLSGCGGYGCGVVFKVDSAGTETVLYSFTGGTDGGYPDAGLVEDPKHNLYGTTEYGGDLSNCGGYGCGVVFKVEPTGKESVLYSFTGGSDGSNPLAGLVRDPAGNLYGTTEAGGGDPAEYGVVFKLDPTGKETVLHTFTGGSDGEFPIAPVIRDAAGNLYGTTLDGGPYSWGVVFKLDPTGEETVLYAFTGAADGGNPDGALVRDAEGNLYGPTEFGGAHGCYGCTGGVVYEVTPTGKETVLHSFKGGTDGICPSGALVRDTAGNLYGTTCAGGDYNAGVVFEIGKSGETILYTFTGFNDGYTPNGSLIRDAAGNLYGTASLGGASGYGTVFELIP